MFELFACGTHLLCNIHQEVAKLYFLGVSNTISLTESDDWELFLEKLAEEIVTKKQLRCEVNASVHCLCFPLAQVHASHLLT